MTRFAGRNNMGQMAAALVGAAAAQAVPPIVNELERQVKQLKAIAERIEDQDWPLGMPPLTPADIEQAVKALPDVPGDRVVADLARMAMELRTAVDHRASGDHRQHDDEEAQIHEDAAEDLALGLVLANQKGQQQ